MDKRQQNENGGVVCVSNGHGKLKHICLWAGVVIAGVAIGVGSYVAFWRPVRQQAAAEQKESFRQEIVATEKLAAKNDFTAEAETLKAKLQQNPTQEEKETVIIRLGASYTNAKNYDEAIKWYQLAVDQYPDIKLGGTRGLAFVHMHRGKDKHNKADYEKAIQYFEQAKTIENTDPMSNQLIESEENNIRYVKSLMAAEQNADSHSN